MQILQKNAQRAFEKALKTCQDFAAFFSKAKALKTTSMFWALCSFVKEHKNRQCFGRFF